MIRKTLYALFSLLLFVLLLQGCVTEESCYRGMLGDGLRPTFLNSDGTVATDSMARIAGVYKFVNGQFAGALEPISDSTYALPINDCDNIEVVALATHISDDFNMETANSDTKLSDVWASLMSTTQGNLQIYSGRVWYGRWAYPSGEHLKGVVTLPMTNHAARVTVVVDNLKRCYGEGTYAVKVSGFCRSIAYDGSVRGEAIDYRPKVVISDDRLTASAVCSLPASAKGITVEVTRDRQPVLTAVATGDGQPITLQAGEDKIVKIDAITATTTISVSNWHDASSYFEIHRSRVGVR